MAPVKSADLCWGQRYIWLRHHQLPERARHEAHIIGRFDLPEGIAVAQVRSTVNYLVRRHEALRTTYDFDAGGPRQRVHPPGPVPLETVTVERDGTPSPAEVIDRLSTTAFDLATEWPVRACVVSAAGAPKQLVLVLNHMAFDAWTMDRFERELAALGGGIAARRPVSLEPIRHQPADLARYESGAEATAVRDRALDYWRAEIATLPSDGFALRRERDPEPAAHSATLTSPSMVDAVRRIADRNQVWASLVHVTAYTMLMAAYTGAGEVSHLSFTGNRADNAYTDVMTCMFSPLLMRVDCADNPTFAQLLKRAAQRFDLAQDHAQLPYDEFVELLAAESVRRGEPVRTSSELNFLNHNTHHSRARRTKFVRNPEPWAWAEYGGDTFFRIFELADAVVVGLHARTTVMDDDAIEKFLRGYEAVLLAHGDAATDLRVDEVAALAGFTPPAHTAPVDAEAVAAVLRAHPGVLAATVSTSDNDALVADVTGEATPAQLRTHVLGLAHDHPRLRCPDVFRMGGNESDGRDGEPVPAATDAEHALAAAVADANGLDVVDLADSYTGAGGRALCVPHVLALLAERGWTGLTVHGLTGGRPLLVLAARLHEAG